jgi:hypothetical protein
MPTSKEPDGVEDVLHSDAVRPKPEDGVQSLPRKIQRQGIERNRVGFVAKANPDAVDIDHRPAEAADDREN